MNNPPNFAIRKYAPRPLSKMLKFANRAWTQANWCGDADTPGPLYNFKGGLSSLSLRVVEHWKYDIGGGLVDPLHYDVDSVITIVALLSRQEDFEGGDFRTNECDGTQLLHPMTKGDVICFVSHKYHNVTTVTKGSRKSFVIELWQGASGQAGR